MTRRRRAANGFTLIELMVVMVLMALMMAAALPQLWPSIAIAGLEGQAHHLANFGRAAVAHCTLMRERFLIKIDLQNQKYWAEKQEQDPQALGIQTDKKNANKPQQPFVPLAQQDPTTLNKMDPQERARQCRQAMEMFVRTAIEARAANVAQADDGMLKDVGPKFKKFELGGDKKKDNTVRLNLLEPTNMPDNVTIDSVLVGGKTYNQGTVEVQILPLGLTQNVVFYLKGEDGDFYTVIWDAITGGSRVYDGKRENP